MSPSIIILDEATSMLDPKGKKEINELVRELNKDKDITILSITHDIEEAALADKVILLSDGHVIDSGKPEDILLKEDLLKEMALDIPFSLKISKGLNKLGIKVSNQIKQEELVRELCQLHSTK